MNWEEVGAIGQVLGSIAVFITLGYLAVQLRHARAEVKRSIITTRASMVRDQAMAAATDADLNRLNAKAAMALGSQFSPFQAELMKRTDLTADEAYRLHWEQAALWEIRQESIRYMNELPTTEREAFDVRNRSAYRAGSVTRLWYETNRSSLSAEFVRYIDNLIAQPT